jgi:hypothetical protein
MVRLTKGSLDALKWRLIPHWAKDPKTAYKSINARTETAFGSMDKPWKPGYLRSAYGTTRCRKFKPKNMTDDIFLAQILGHKLLGPNAALSVGQSYKDFYVA